MLYSANMQVTAPGGTAARGHARQIRDIPTRTLQIDPEQLTLLDLGRRAGGHFDKLPIWDQRRPVSRRNARAHLALVATILGASAAAVTRRQLPVTSLQLAYHAEDLAEVDSRAVVGALSALATVWWLIVRLDELLQLMAALRRSVPRRTDPPVRRRATSPAGAGGRPPPRLLVFSLTAAPLGP